MLWVRHTSDACRLRLAALPGLCVMDTSDACVAGQRPEAWVVGQRPQASHRPRGRPLEHVVVVPAQRRLELPRCDTARALTAAMNTRTVITIAIIISIAIIILAVAAQGPGGPRGGEQQSASLGPGERVGLGKGGLRNLLHAAGFGLTEGPIPRYIAASGAGRRREISYVS